MLLEHAEPRRTADMAFFLSSLWSDSRGNVALVLGLALPVLAGGVAGAMDLNTWYSARVRLQHAADAAALGAAREMQLPGATASQVTAAAVSIVNSTLEKAGPRPSRVAADPAFRAKTVRVEVEAEVSPLFSRALVSGLQKVGTSAVARLSNSTPVCMVGLDTRMEGTVKLESRAQLTAHACAVYSNSTHSRGLQGAGGAAARATLFCSAGGYSGTGVFTPQPATDCPAIGDPLKDRPLPSAGPCVAHNKTLKGATETLSPGTYCGGLNVTNGSAATLQPGIYVIKGGPLVVDRFSSLAGTNVAFFFSGDKAALLFDKNSTIRLTAPKDGPMAGLLISEERMLTSYVEAPQPLDLLGLVGSVVSALVPALPVGSPPMREFRIISDNARTLIGTIYIPNGRLIVDSSKSVADLSAYTVIVARRFDLYDGPNLQLNTDYSASDVPVPPGVGPTQGRVALSE